MEEDLGECLILKTFLGGSPPCSRTCTHRKFPSYHDAGRGRGCWTAHTALCILEAIRVKNDILAILNRRNIKWRTLILTLLLHDSGKLSKDYTSRNKPEIPHNEVSAQIAHDVLAGLQEMGYVDDEEKEIVSRACFLHMEYYLWRNMSRGGFTTINQITSPSTVVELADGIQEPLENLKLVLKEAGEFEEPTFLVISEISKIRHIKLMPSRYTIGKDWKTLLKIISLQWFILLFDNRASSARGVIDYYWDKLLEDAMKSSLGAKSYAERIIKFSDYLLSRLRGKLTPLSKIQFQVF